MGRIIILTLFTLRCGDESVLSSAALCPAHQLDVSVAHDGAELAQVLHHHIDKLSGAFPLVAAHFLGTGQLHLQRHQVCLWGQRSRYGCDDYKSEKKKCKKYKQTKKTAAAAKVRPDLISILATRAEKDKGH